MERTSRRTKQHPDGIQYPRPNKKQSGTYALSGEIRRFAFQFGEDLQELLQESNKLRSQIIFVLDVRSSLRVAGPDRLFDVQHTGQVCPAVLVHRGLVLTPTPRERLPKRGHVYPQRGRSLGTKNEVSYPMLLK